MLCTARIANPVHRTDISIYPCNELEETFRRLKRLELALQTEPPALNAFDISIILLWVENVEILESNVTMGLETLAWSHPHFFE